MNLKVPDPNSAEKLRHRVQKIKRSEDFNYWKKCANEYITSQESKQTKDEVQFRQTET